MARAIGRNLSPIQGCLVQIAAVAILAALVWAFFASGLFMRIAEPFARWYADQVLPAPSPSVTP